MKIAFGRLGMGENEFYTSTLRYVWLRYMGWLDHQNELYRDNWERTRLQAYNAVLPYMKKSVPVTEWMPFRWDKVKEVPGLTQEQLEHLNRFAPPILNY